MVNYPYKFRKTSKTLLKLSNVSHIIVASVSVVWLYDMTVNYPNGTSTWAKCYDTQGHITGVFYYNFF